MLWILLGIAAVILAIIYPAVAVIAVIAFTVYNIFRLVQAIRVGAAISGLIVNGICSVVGIALLIWAFMP